MLQKVYQENKQICPRQGYDENIDLHCVFINTLSLVFALIMIKRRIKDLNLSTHENEG